MTIKDTGQKIALRRAFWALGAATRLEVKLGALVRVEKARPDREEWTDVDVLAVHYSALTGLTMVIADCTTSRGRVAERLFWLRGVMDLIGANQAFLVRDENLSSAARQLALRLGITALGSDDRAVLLAEVGGNGGDVPASMTKEGIERQALVLRSAPRELERLTRYRDTGYWLSRGHRNLTTLPSFLSASRDQLPAASPWTLPLVVDLAWLYLLACTRALVDITTLHLADPGEGLANAVVGDERERREKEFLAERLRRLFAVVPRESAALPVVDVFPAYYGDLTDLMSRLLRRRGSIVGALRALELAAVASAQPKGTAVIHSPDEDAYSWKLASDAVRFLVRTCRLERTLQDQFDTLASEATTNASRPTGDQTADAHPAKGDATSSEAGSDANATSAASTVGGTPPTQISLFVDPSAHGRAPGVNNDNDLG